MPRTVRTMLGVAVGSGCVLLLTLAISCGGDSGGGGSTLPPTQSAEGAGSVNSAGTGSDDQYLKALCVAARALADANKKESQSAKSFDELAKKLTGPYQEYARGFAAANPPSDLKERHDAAAAKINAAVAVLARDGNSKALDGVAQAPFFEFPEPARGRLADLAPKMTECNNLTFAGIAGDLR